MMIRLPFELPPFTRITWASPTIRATWEPRLERVRDALASGEHPSRWSGILSARIAKLYPYQEQAWMDEARALGLAAARLEGDPGDWSRDEDVSSGKAILVVAGRADLVTKARQVRAASDLAAPDCCRCKAAEFAALGLRSRELRLLVASVPEARCGHPAMIRQAWETNLFWHSIGVSPLPYVPCAVGCEQSRAVAQALATRMAVARLPEEADWLREMLSWSLSWSALHGIAELKTPVFKACGATDATAGRHELRLEGDSPADAAPGIGFPYLPKRRLPMH